MTVLRVNFNIGFTQLRYGLVLRREVRHRLLQRPAALFEESLPARPRHERDPNEGAAPSHALDTRVSQRAFLSANGVMVCCSDESRERGLRC